MADVPLQHSKTGQVRMVPIEQVGTYAKRRLASGELEWIARTGVPGFKKMGDGTLKQVVIPKEMVNTVARNAGRQGYNYSFATGGASGAGADDRFGIAQGDAIRRAQVDVARQQSFGEVFADKAASTATFGLTGYLGNYLAGKDAGELRAIRASENRGAEIAGTILGAGLSSYAGGGILGKIASGLTPARVTAHMALGLDKAGRVGRVAKKLVKVGQYEVPASAAAAIADAVEYNKPLTGQALAARMGVDFMIGAGLYFGPGALVLRLARKQGVPGIRGAREKLWRFGDAAEKGSSLTGQFGQSKAVGVTPGGGLRTVARLAKMIGRKPALRVVAGEAGENIITAGKTTRASLAGLDPDAVTAKQLRTNAEEFMARLNSGKIPDDPAARQFAMDIIENADEIIKARKQVGGAVVAAKNASAAGVGLKSPTTALMSDASGSLGWGMQSAATKLTRGVRGLQESDELFKLNVRLFDLGEQMKKRTGQRAFNQALEMRQELSRMITPGPNANRIRAAMAEIDASMLNASGQSEDVFKMLAKIDEFNDAIDQLANMAESFTKAGDVLDPSGVRQFNAMMKVASESADELGRLGALKGNRGALNALKKAELDMQAVEKMASMNASRAAILGDLPPSAFLENAPRAATMQEDVLDATIDAVAHHKGRMEEAFDFIDRWQPGAAMQRSLVLGVRQLTSAEDVRMEFRRKRDLVVEAASSPQAQMANVGFATDPFSRNDADVGTNLALAGVTAGSYLLQQMPRSDDPMIEAEDMSATEMESWLEIDSALDDPVGVVASCADGSCTVEAVQAIATVYPALYADMQIDVAEFLNERRGKQFPYETLVGLDTFMGGALGVLDSHNPYAELGAQTPLQQQALGYNPQQSSPMMAQMQGKVASTPAQKVGAM